MFNNKVECDICRHEFDTNRIDIKEKTEIVASEECKISFFVCPICDTEYPVLVTNTDLAGKLEKHKENRVRLQIMSKTNQKGTLKWQKLSFAVMDEKAELAKAIDQKIQDYLST